ncbi:hypothetical protein F5J12DRAFT_786157 [Pisolithus orientalis]|uniref:uncharacterized protein n=1 Tax=Pisolithus orientalis TaxID=936130 RepID=UPI002225277E|nr:uncharacterized protein F5J12DRAFT_786157 [Pisolithus orientalis]KAI5992362.1 hypothetical protein F5J12DRAFT_786157 [Pisolithus orientalis]
MTLGCKALQWTIMCFNSVIKPQGQHPGECWFNPTFSHMFIKVIYVEKPRGNDGTSHPPFLEATGRSHDSLGGYFGMSQPPLWRCYHGTCHPLLWRPVLQDNQIHHAEHSEGPMSQIKWGKIVQLQMVTAWWV